MVPFRVVAFACLLGWGYYVTAVFRGSEAEPSLPLLCIVPMMYVAPFASIAFVGLRWRHYCAVLTILVVVPALAAEAQCTLEETLFVERMGTLPPAAPTVFKSQRWWPNETSYLYYEPSTATLGGGD